MAESSATKTMKRMLRTRGAAVAAVTAAAVALALVVTHVLREVIQFIGLSATPGLYDLEYLGPSFWQSLAYTFFTTILPFAVGFFLSLWIVAPISEQLGIGHVITRAVLATGIGATLWFIVSALVSIVSTLGFDRPIFSNSFPQLQGVEAIPSILGWSLQGALVGFVTLLPLGILAGILLWHWRKANPPQFHVEGLIDV